MNENVMRLNIYDIPSSGHVGQDMKHSANSYKLRLVVCVRKRSTKKKTELTKQIITTKCGTIAGHSKTLGVDEVVRKEGMANRL